MRLSGNAALFRCFKCNHDDREKSIGKLKHHSGVRRLRRLAEIGKVRISSFQFRQLNRGQSGPPEQSLLDRVFRKTSLALESEEHASSSAESQVLCVQEQSICSPAFANRQASQQNSSCSPSGHWQGSLAQTTIPILRTSFSDMSPLHPCEPRKDRPTDLSARSLQMFCN